MKMFSFFRKNIKEPEKEQSSFEIELTASVLAYELARSDGEITHDELSILMDEIESIANKVGKDKEEIFKIIKIYSEDSVSFHEFVEDINKNYSKEEKLNLLKFMWKIAYADKKLDVDEERLIRRMADLIMIKDVEVLKLKSLVKPTNI
ncbi:MAG: TerB family tellurite resistance protein [Gammaproteobacteria bacterium]